MSRFCSTHLDRLLLVLPCALGSAALAQTAPDPSGRATLAATTAATSAPACTLLGNFYWEIGGAGGRLASGAVGSEYSASSTMDIASASKWVFGAYANEVTRHRALSADEIRKLNLTSGYTSQNQLSCLLALRVQGCLAGPQTAANEGAFHYNGGHLQRLAIDLGLGPHTKQQLTNSYNAALGDFGMTFRSANVAGGMHGSAEGYGRFLQKVLRGELAIHQRLGANAVCTSTASPGTCNAQYSPSNQPTWNYSHGHWVERDAGGAVEAYSSPGLFGFYPWISADKSYYGIVARQSRQEQAYNHSAACGRAIRQAFTAALRAP